MSRHAHDDGVLTRRTVDYEYARCHEGGEPGPPVVRSVPVEACIICDECWFDEDTGIALSRILEENEPLPAGS